MDFFLSETLPPDVTALLEPLCESYQDAVDSLDGADLAAFAAEEQRLHQEFRSTVKAIAAGRC